MRNAPISDLDPLPDDPAACIREFEDSTEIDLDRDARRAAVSDSNVSPRDPLFES